MEYDRQALSNALHDQDKLSPEQRDYYAALSNQIGNKCKNAGDLKTAVVYYQQAVVLQPDLADVHNNLGDALQQMGQIDAALRSYCQAISIKPDFAYAYNNLGNIYKQKGQLKEAVTAYQQALKLEPGLALIHSNLGNAFKAMDKLEAAVESYQESIRLKPDIAMVHYNLGNAFQAMGKLEAAVASYERTLTIQPEFTHAKFALLMSQLPIIYSSTEEITDRRDNYYKYLQSLASHYRDISQEERAKAADAVGSLQPFYLTYQGLNDRDLQQIYGQMICQISASCYPQWSQPIHTPIIEPDEKIRVGFVSGFLINHSNWKIPIKGWVENLDRSEFELFGYHTGSKRDRETVVAAKAFDKFTQGPLLLEQWCELIRQDRLHILIFPEFGMDPMSVKLGCLRLAAIQMTSWGHPETSGLATIDYYLSSELMESENAQEHYTEKLVKLPNLSIYYTPLAIQPQPRSKQDIGIDNDEIMFWCCQSLFKYLPQYDDIFARIARDLRNSKFVFIKHTSERITEVFCQRLSRVFEEFGLNYQDHCIFLPFMNSKTFAGTAAIADVFLDSIGWSGCNSSLESVAHNTPVLTLSGELMRGRHSMAILKMMGIEETIAATKEDYVKIAVRLGKDAQYRQYISDLIAENKHKLYNDLKPVKALEDFFFKALNKTRRNTTQVAEVLRLAMHHHRTNRLVDAQQSYHQVLVQQPNHPEALYGLGILAQQMGQLQEAEQFLSASVQVQPDSVKGWFSLGNLYQAQGQLPEAEKAYQQAITLRPDAGTIYNNLGYTLQQQGKLAEAETCYQKALELQPNCVEADVNLGNTLHTQGKLSAEKQAYYAQLNYKLGIARKQAGDWKTAVIYYRQAIAIQSDLVDAHFNLGVVLQEQGELEEAIACYQRVLEYNPQSREAHIRLEQIYQTQQKLEVS
ncbi:MAG: tetratricopeptide repeat protein [Scytonema sp. PMC 1069.18]|nr:tetratricopeptide repeat protein [Scytonema sp. PMC 1069.18]MEC4880879.1 tetratricopeptide repeat protein [Scytonema sp. PMC 1070.18]